MQQKKIFSGYTLVEIIVVISIIGIVIFAMGNFNFTRLTQKQQTSIENIKIKSIFEEVRNNHTYGRAILSGSLVPLAWNIDVSTAWSGRVISEYLSGSTWVNFQRSWNTSPPIFLSSVICKNLTGTISGTLTGTGKITFSGSEINISGTNCSNQNIKVIELQLQNRGLSETLRFNTVTGILEIF